MYGMGCQVLSDSVARSLVDSHALPALVALLRSENSDVLELTCRILDHIARHPILNEVVVSTNAPRFLAALLRFECLPVMIHTPYSDPNL